MAVRHPKSRGEGFDPTSDEIITANWSFTGTLTIPAASVTAHESAIDHDQLKNFDQAEHFTMSQIQIDSSQVTGISATGLQNVVEDLTPQLGADLDANCFKIENAKALYLKHGTSSASIAGQGQLTVATDKSPRFTNDVGLDSRLARLNIQETITSDWTHQASLIMGDEQIVKWLDDSSVEKDMLALKSRTGVGASVKHIITKITTGISTTSAAFVDVTGASVAFSAMGANTDYAVFVRAYHGNSTSTTTPVNEIRLTKDDTLVPGSFSQYESPSTVIDDNGVMYIWGGIINSGSQGDLQLEINSGNGSDTVFANNVTIMMIKVDDLILNTNIFHDTDTSLLEIDQGTWQSTGAAVTIGDGVSDYLVFGSMRITDFLTGGNKVSIRVNDGTTPKEAGNKGRGDASDQHTLGFVQLWQAPAAATTLTVEADNGEGFPVDKDYASIIAIRVSALTDYVADVLAVSPDLGDGPNTLATVAFTTSVTGDYALIAGSAGTVNSAIGAAPFVRNDLNGGGDATVAGSETQLVAENIISGTPIVPRFMVANLALTAADTVDADYVASDAGTPITFTDNFLIGFQWSLAATAQDFDIGNSEFMTRSLGSSFRLFDDDESDWADFAIASGDMTVSSQNLTNFTITGFDLINAGSVDADFDQITATSYGGVLEANLLDKTATETISAAWTFESTNKLNFGTTGEASINFDNSVLHINMRLTNDIVSFDEADVAKFQIDHDQAEIRIRDGYKLRIGDSTDVDDVTFSHDGDDFNIAGTTTTDINITGITAIAAGTVDADFDAITGTSYGGITEANLVDKTFGEAISGAWDFTGNTISLSNTSPNLRFNDTDGGVDEKRLTIRYQSGQFRIQNKTDADASPVTWMTMDRTGTVTDDVTITATAIQMIGALTATSFGGITSANLVDKSASESIAANWNFTQSLTMTNNKSINMRKADATSLAMLFIDAGDIFQIGTPTLATNIKGSAVTLAASVESTEEVIFSGIVSAALTGSVNNYDPGTFSEASGLFLSADGDYNITGLLAGVDGRIVIITVDDNTNTINLVHESASSSAANRFACPGLADVLIPVRGSATLQYKGSRWYVISEVN